LATRALFAERQAKIFGNMGAGFGTSVSCRIARHLASSPLGNTYPPFELSVVDMFGDVSVLEDLVGFFETLFQISPRFFDRRAKSTFPHREITFRSDLWRIWF